MLLSVRRSTELFHLVFLRALVAKGADKGLVALKGGCNLRFFGAAIRQKIHALAARTEPQARDVFDLALLLTRTDAGKLVLDAAAKKWLEDAIDHAMGLSFDEYASKVVAFLEPNHAEIYADRSAWNAMQEDVIARLEALR